MQSKEELLKKEAFDLTDLCEIMQILRAPGGCPWDREQTHDSIRQNMIEEAYEACDAIDHRDAASLCEELGDLMMQVVFHAQIAEESGTFTLSDVFRGVCEKLIVRHPHVFGELTVRDSGEVLSNWESIKNETKGMQTLKDTLEGVALALPALMRAQKLGSRTRKAGLDPRALMPEAKSEKERIGRELFEVCLRAKEAGIDAEEALTDYNTLYTNRA